MLFGLAIVTVGCLYGWATTRDSPRLHAGYLVAIIAFGLATIVTGALA